MILPALVRLYERLAAEEDSDLPRLGWSRRGVSFVLEINEAGEVEQLHDVRSKDGRRRTPRGMVVPDHGATRTSAAKDLPYFLCDATAFILGADDKKGDKAAAYFDSSRRRHLALLEGCNDPGAVAVCNFFRTWDPARAREIAADFDWAKEVSGMNVAFRLEGEDLHRNPVLARLWQAHFDARPDAEQGQCLVTGVTAPIARTHPGIKLVTNERDAEKERTIGRKHVVPYALYRAEGYISAHLAARTGFTEDDLALFWKALVNMFDHDRSASRGRMSARKLIAFKHASKLGDAPAQTLFDAVDVKRATDSEAPARAYKDYRVDIDRAAIPKGVEVVELL